MLPQTGKEVTYSAGGGGWVFASGVAVGQNTSSHGLSLAARLCHGPSTVAGPSRRRLPIRHLRSHDPSVGGDIEGILRWPVAHLSKICLSIAGGGPNR